MICFGDKDRIQERHAAAEEYGAEIVLKPYPGISPFEGADPSDAPDPSFMTNMENELPVYGDTALNFAEFEPTSGEPGIPERIRGMMALYEHGDGGFARKCKNFYLQGKFMEDYEDDMPWEGELRLYFPTYHDLSLRQLRGYFTWRTEVRRGHYCPIAASLSYIYLYELLSGIGTSSPEDAFHKMREFEAGFLDSGIGDPSIRKNLRRWMQEYAVVHDLPAESARMSADPVMMEKDAALAVLRASESHTDEDVFNALLTLSGGKPKRSPVVERNRQRGEHLFAEVWRYAAEKWQRNEKTLFDACFGGKKRFRWYPLANAICWGPGRHEDTDYTLNESRSFHCRNGRWEEWRYEELYFDKARLRGLLHETDRALRTYLKIGTPLRERPEEAWARPYVEAVIDADRMTQTEAARPKITIDFFGLDQIRQNAEITKESLLTEEEKDGAPPTEEIPGRDAASSGGYGENGMVPAAFRSSMETEQPEDTAATESTAEGTATPADAPAQANRAAGDAALSPSGTAEETAGAANGLDDVHLEILSALLRGESAEARIRENHLMPELVTDRINEVFYDRIGDRVLECDGKEITLTEDYREELTEILRERSAGEKA